MATITIGENSYITEAELQTYADDREITISGTLATLILKAMDWLELQPFKGYKYDEDQALEFPRVVSSEYDYDVVPNNIKTAQIVACLLIDSGEDLQANLTQSVKREKVDVIEIEYQDNSDSNIVYTQLNNLLRPFVNSNGLKLVRA